MIIGYISWEGCQSNFRIVETDSIPKTFPFAGPPTDELKPVALLGSWLTLLVVTLAPYGEHSWTKIYWKPSSNLVWLIKWSTNEVYPQPCNPLRLLRLQKRGNVTPCASKGIADKVWHPAPTKLVPGCSWNGVRSLTDTPSGRSIAVSSDQLLTLWCANSNP